MEIRPYLMFDGRTDEALAFYGKAIGAKVTAVMRFKESPDQKMIPPGAAEKVMHSEFTVGGSTIMATDGYNQGKATFKGVTLTLMAKTDDEAKHLFDALADGGKVEMPLGKTFFASSFGVLADRFGVNWMVLAGAG